MAALWNLVFLACCVLLLGVEIRGQGCSGVKCPRGRMCVSNRDDGRVFTQCVCPESCPSVQDPVCSVYHTEFPNPCEMHKFACANNVPIRVKNRGFCDVNDLNEVRRVRCPNDALLQFPNRYLEWLMIAREKSFDRNFQLTDRVDSLNDEQRKTILRWEFDLLDKDKNLYVDQDELLRIRETLGPMEPCIYGFLQACDQSNQTTFSGRDWEGCFPLSGTTIGSKLK